MVIRASDRVATVLQRDESLLEVFVAASPLFERLRSASMRRTMGRLVTVAQAARLAGLEPEVLLERLNRGGTEGPPPPAPPAPAPEPERVERTPLPAALREIPPERIVEVDVREDLRRGEEPFSRIMAARKTVPAGGALRVRAIFEPVPLYAVMARQGLDHWTERLAEDDWVVWFHPAAAAVEAPATEPPPAGRSEPEESRYVVLDVRGMEPPEPMVRTLAALETLAPGNTLVHINVRAPHFLLPKLEALGFAYEVTEQSNGQVRVLIWRAG